MKKSTFSHKIELFSKLSKREQSIIEKLGVKKEFKKGEIILREGEKGSFLYIINSGEVKISLFSDKGKEIVITHLKEGDFFGEIGFFSEEYRTARVTAIKDTKVTIFSRDVLLNRLMKHPEILVSIIKEMANRIKKTNEKMSSLLFLDLSGKIARFFIEKAIKEGERIGEYIYIKKDFKIKDLASLIGCSRESVSRILKEFKKTQTIKFSSKGVFIHKDALKFK
ncbi:MAG: Crp/Fnr family transcriptional regulator [Candidatus Hydrothermales bacterium]